MVGLANASLHGIFSEHAGAGSLGFSALDNIGVTNGGASLNTVLRVSDSMFSLRINAELMGVLSGSLAGIVNVNTQKVQNAALLNSSRTIRQVLDQIVITQITEDLARLRELQREKNELIGERNTIESRYLTDEQMTQAPDESDAEFFERKRRLLEQAVENGDMSQEEFDRWLEINARLLAIEAEKDQILDRLRENGAEALAFRELQREEHSLTNRFNSLDATIVHNESSVERLRAARGMDVERADSALAVILSDYPDIAARVPAHLDVYEQIDYVDLAINLETNTARAEQIEVQLQREEVQAVTTTLIETMGDRVDLNLITDSVFDSEGVIAEQSAAYSAEAGIDGALSASLANSMDMSF